MYLLCSAASLSDRHSSISRLSEQLYAKHANTEGLERSILVRTSITLAPTSTPNVAHLLPSASRGGAVFGNDTALGLQKVVCLNKRLVSQHRICDIGPESGIKRRCSGPCAVDIVGGARVVFEFPDRGCPGQRLRNIGEICLDAHDFKSLGVYLVSLVAGVVASQRGDGRTDETHSQRLGDVNVVCVTEGSVETCRFVVVED